MFMVCSFLVNITELVCDWMNTTNIIHSMNSVYTYVPHNVMSYVVFVSLVGVS
jgi:hypothetical protein